MKHITENILEIALCAVIVAFMLFVLFTSKINGQTGIFNALSNNKYNSIDYDINQSVVEEATDEMRQNTKVEGFSLSYSEGLQHTCNPVQLTDGTWGWSNIYRFKDFITVSYEGNEYRYDKNTDTWLIKNSAGNYIAQTESAPKYFSIYIMDIRNKNGGSVLTVDSINNISDDIPTNIFYNDDTDEIACFISGSYIFRVRITEKTTNNFIEKQIKIPFQAE